MFYLSHLKFRLGDECQSLANICILFSDNALLDVILFMSAFLMGLLLICVQTTVRCSGFSVILCNTMVQSWHNICIIWGVLDLMTSGVGILLFFIPSNLQVFRNFSFDVSQIDQVVLV